MVNNNFVSILPSNSKGLSGVWTGNNGPYLTTYKFNQDGTGLMCYSYGTSNIVEKVKVYDDVVYLQSGIKQKVKTYTPDSLVLHSNYYGTNTTFKYVPDRDFSDASSFCSDQLK